MSEVKSITIKREKYEGTTGFDTIVYIEDFNDFVTRVTNVINNIKNAKIISISYPTENIAVIVYKDYNKNEMEALKQINNRINELSKAFPADTAFDYFKGVGIAYNNMNKEITKILKDNNIVLD